MPDGADVNSVAIIDLRHELKVWEKSFAAANGGRKAGRDDIKKDATISTKYKEYDRLTRRVTKAVSTPRKDTKSECRIVRDEVLNECPPNVISTTPTRKADHKTNSRLLEVTEVPEERPTPAIVRCALGPTPQKDGEILGIFDMLPGGTPSKDVEVSTSAPDGSIGATPSKSAALPSSNHNASRTPQSSAKRIFFEAFAATPLKRKREDEGEYTPSTAKRQFATPAFLRRRFPLSRIDEDSTDTGATAPPFKKRGLVRSLSTIIQGLRKQEEERMEDEWDVMNEIEADERGETRQAKGTQVLVEDSQAVEMPLGPDQGAESDNDADLHDAPALDANGKPRKVWKKKGLKRQTRRVIMRPVVHHPQKITGRQQSHSEASDSGEVAETQIHNQELEPADLEEADELICRHDSPHLLRKADEHKSGSRESRKAEGQKHTTVEDDGTTTRARKVIPQAHANFRKLKIKNKNSKAKGRGAGRFSRR